MGVAVTGRGGGEEEGWRRRAGQPPRGCQYTRGLDAFERAIQIVNIARGYWKCARARHDSSSVYVRSVCAADGIFFSKLLFFQKAFFSVVNFYCYFFFFTLVKSRFSIFFFFLLSFIPSKFFVVYLHPTTIKTIDIHLHCGNNDESAVGDRI